MADQNTPQLDQLPYALRNRYEAYQSLRRLINITGDQEALGDLSALAMCLANADSSEPFFDLNIWAGLLIDTPDMGQDYGKDVLECDYLRYLWEKHLSSTQEKSELLIKTNIPDQDKKERPATLIASSLLSVVALLPL